MSDVILEVSLGFFWLRSSGPNPKGKFVSLKKQGENPHL